MTNRTLITGIGMGLVLLVGASRMHSQAGGQNGTGGMATGTAAAPVYDGSRRPITAGGFVKTGPALGKSPHWTAGRQPFLLETSHAGVFAAGDVRSSSVKRVASAVGEGAMAVQFVHEYLKEM